MFHINSQLQRNAKAHSHTIGTHESQHNNGKNNNQAIAYSIGRRRNNNNNNENARTRKKNTINLSFGISSLRRCRSYGIATIIFAPHSSSVVAIKIVLIVVSFSRVSFGQHVKMLHRPKSSDFNGFFSLFVCLGLFRLNFFCGSYLKLTQQPQTNWNLKT